ncbi:hypothetical protein IJ541_01035 [bacterium]|nr:hypothetical protein [bacterium]
MADDWTFRIKRSEIGQYSGSGRTLDVSDEFLSKFTDKVIEHAKELQAKHGSKYSDEFYLTQAKQIEIEKMFGRFNQIHHNNVNRCNIKDIDWAGFSYEEIIQMENAGYPNIPEEVLQWAHSMQQSDITDYVIITETNDTDITDDATGQNELNKLRTKALQNISKSEEAQKETEAKIEEYKIIEEKAKEIQEEKEDTYEDSMKEITTLTDEWKQLNEKQKNGKLTNEEKSKFNNLSKMLNGKDGSLMTEIQADNAELENFLETLDGLNETIELNSKIAQDTIQSSTDLSQYEKQYYEEQLPVFAAEARYHGMGLDSDTLFNIRTSEIADVALDKGKDLQELSDTILADLTSGESIKLAHFATNYTNLAQQTQDNTQNTMGEDFDKSSEDIDNENKNGLKEYSVDMEFTYQNALKASLTTAESTADLIGKQLSVINSNNRLNKEMAKAQKDVLRLIKDSAKATEKHEDFMKQEEEFLVKLEELTGKKETGSTENKVENVIEDSKEEKSKEKYTPKEDLGPEVQEAKKKQEEKVQIVDQIKDVDDKDNKEKDKVKKSVSKGVQSTSKTQGAEKELTDKNEVLDKRNKNALKVANDTIIVGVGTYSRSFITTATGNILHTTGIGMMSSANPVTVKEGIAMTIAGIGLEKQGNQEMTYGLLAIGTGTAGVGASAAAEGTELGAKAASKSSQIMVKTNKALFKETLQNIGEEANVEISDNSDSGSNPTEAKSENSEETNNQETEENQEIKEETAKTEQASDSEKTTNSEEVPEDSDSTQQTDETNNEQGTENTTEAGTQEEKQEDENAVSMEFSAENAIKATKTTIKTSTELAQKQSGIEKISENVVSETKKSVNIVKNVEKDTRNAIARHQANAMQTQALSAEYASAENQMQNPTSTQDIMTAQEKISNITAQYDAVTRTDEQVTTEANKTVSGSMNQINNFQNRAAELGKDLTDFKSELSTQLDVSEKTLVVGLGTSTKGIFNTTKGSGQIAEGTALLSNPLTHLEGVIEIAKGIKNITQGTLEIGTGTVAATTATNGLIQNGTAQVAQLVSEAVQQSAKAQYKESEKVITETSKELDTSIEKNENPTGNTQEPQIEASTEEEQSEEETAIAASATINANVAGITTTDDKEDRRLTRFNTESIIESKKKKKKVVAVSASAKG